MFNKGFAEEIWDKWQSLPDGQKKKAFAELFVSIEEELHYYDHPVEALFFFERLEKILGGVENADKAGHRATLA